MFRAGHEMDESMFITGRMHQGIVVNNTDDTTKSGKCRIRIKSLHTGIPDEDLPYMMPAANNSDKSGNATTTGSINVPPTGAVVWCRFDTESVYHGFYHGSVPTNNASPDQFTASSDTDPDSGENPNTDDTGVSQSYPLANANVDQSGHQYIINNKTDQSIYTHVSGSGTNIDANGSTVRNVGNYSNPNPNAVATNPKGDTTNVQGPSVTNTNGNYTLNITGDVNIVASGNVSVSSQKTVTILAATDVTVESDSTIHVTSNNGDLNLTSLQKNVNLNAPNGFVQANGSLNLGVWIPGNTPVDIPTPPTPQAPPTTPTVKNRTRPVLPVVANMINL